MKLTKENFMFAVNSIRGWNYETEVTLFCYICQEKMSLKNVKYIYGRMNFALLGPEEIGRKIRDTLEEMWLIALKEQKKNPKLTHILGSFNDHKKM